MFFNFYYKKNILLINKKLNFFNEFNIFSKLIKNHIIYYPTPLNINYNWSFGSLAGLFFAGQIITGFFLTCHYIPNIELAFWSLEHIMRDVNFGWLLRYLHANGASFVFIMMYLHIAKALYFKSYIPGIYQIHLFYSGILIFFLMMGTAFIGYVLPMGQMSLWGATVITNLITAIPFIGNDIAIWIWGGYSVGNPTLNRFLSFHYILPFIITGIILLHLSLLHIKGSTNPVGIINIKDKINFHPYFSIKDTFSLFISLFIFIIIIHFFPNLLGHSDNYITANPLVTPTHIVPEWYFLPFYAILRAIPNKIGGVIATITAILILAILPYIDNSYIKTPLLNNFHKFIFSIFIINFFLLGFLGGSPAEQPYILLSQISSIIYFSFFLFYFIINLLDKKFYK